MTKMFKKLGKNSARALNIFKYYFSPNHFGVYIMISAIIWSVAYLNRYNTNDKSISVIGVAYRDVEANAAEWNITIKSKGNSRKSSYAKAKRDKGRIVEFLVTSGFSNKDIKFTSYRTDPVYKYVKGEKTDKAINYTTTVGVTLENDNVWKVSSAHQGLNEYIIENDIYLSRDEISYMYTELEDLKIEMLADATDNAKVRAEALGNIRGAKIGKIIDAGQGSFQINQRNDFSVSWGGNYDTSSIKKTIRSTVNTVFEVK